MKAWETPTMKYSEFMENNPNYFDSLITSGAIDEVTIASIEKWYGRRTVCDDDNFDVFFARQLDLCLPRYNKMIRLENTEFDAMVNSYRELQRTSAGTISESGTKSKTDTGEDRLNVTESVTVTPDLTTTDNGATAGSTHSEGSNSGETEAASTGHTDAKSVAKQNPQSISYNNAVAGEVPDLNWTYPGSQQQNITDNNSTNNGTSANNTENDSNTSGTNSNTRKQTGKETTIRNRQDARSRNDAGSESSEGSRAQNDLTREIMTGRAGLTPQQALASAVAYIKATSAFAWLKDQLSVCFYLWYEV